MFFKILFITQFLSVALFGQNLPDSIELSSGKIKLYALSNHKTLVRPQVYKALISYLDSQKLSITNYYIQSNESYKSDTLYISVWDKVGIMTIQKSDRINDSLSRIKTKGAKKFKYPKPVGNPGNCFTLIYDLEGDKIIGIDYWE